MNATQTYENPLQAVLGLIVLLLVGCFLGFLLMVAAKTGGNVSRATHMTAVQYINSNCNKNDFFAQAVNTKTGELWEFCKIDDSTIGVIISKRGRTIRGYTFTTKRYTEKKLIDFLSSKGLELINFVGGIIPKE